MRIDPKYRQVAAIFGLMGLAALCAQIWLNLQINPGGLASVIWGLAGYFTILTNALVTYSFLRIAQTGQRLSYDWMSMLTLSMIAVSGVFHVILAPLYTFSGLGWLTNHAFHTIMPAATVWFWLMETTRHAPRFGRPYVWLVWPFGYAAYALTRGALTGWYPYPFMDGSALATGQLALNIALLVALFALLAVGLNGLGRNMPLRTAQ